MTNLMEGQTGLLPGATGVVRVPVTDLRVAPGREAELVNQALLGTPLTVLDPGTDAATDWLRVRLPDYEGWMATAAIETAPGSRPPVRQICVAARSTALTVLDTDDLPTGKPLTVYAGTRLVLAPDAAVNGMEGWVLITLPDGSDALADPAALTPAAPDACGSAAAVIETAQAFLGVPYLWGGLTERGIDCSGLMQIAYRVHGYDLPRDADQQLRGIPTAVAGTAWQPGDLIFYGHAPDRVIHVMLALGAGRVIHAKGGQRVMVQSMDPAQPDYHARPDRYLGARRVIRPPEGSVHEQ